MVVEMYTEMGAGVYDLTYGHMDHDVGFWAGLAAESWERKEPVMELAVGTGRVAIPLMRRCHWYPRGLVMVGVDVTRAMLNVARRKLVAEESLTQSRLALLEGDMRELGSVLRRAGAGDIAVPTRFGLVFVALNSLLHLTTHEDQLQVFTEVRDVLTPDGLFAFDVFNPVPKRLVDEEGPCFFFTHYDKDKQLRVVRYEFNRRVDQARQLINATEHLMIEKGGQRIVDKFVDLELGYLWPRQIQELCRQAGLEIVHFWADYDRSDFWATKNPPKQIIVGRRKE